jgi:uncharacterized membrane protein YphA (DoxX/SURF4 family)
MQRFLGKYSEPVYAVLRLVAGFLFACHGAQKLSGALGGTPQCIHPAIPSPGYDVTRGGVARSMGQAAA